MALLVRHAISLAIVLVALAATAVVLVFARPEYHRDAGLTIDLPATHPADDAAGAAGWVWRDGTPGWEAAATIKGVNVSGVQRVEIQAAQLAAARNGLDADAVRVVAAERPGRDGVLAVLAAPTLEQSPVKTCLAVLLPGNAPVDWKCPGATPSQHDLGRARVLAAAGVYSWPATSAGGERRQALYLVGVARGDVRRVVLDADGLEPQEIYARALTWGQFTAATALPDGAVRLLIYGRGGRVETLALALEPGHARALQ